MTIQEFIQTGNSIVAKWQVVSKRSTTIDKDNTQNYKSVDDIVRDAENDMFNETCQFSEKTEVFDLYDQNDNLIAENLNVKHTDKFIKNYQRK